MINLNGPDRLVLTNLIIIGKISVVIYSLLFLDKSKEGKKKESSFNGLDFEQMQFFTFFVQLIKKWSKTKLLQIKILTYLYK